MGWQPDAYQVLKEMNFLLREHMLLLKLRVIGNRVLIFEEVFETDFRAVDVQTIRYVEERAKASIETVSAPVDVEALECLGRCGEVRWLHDFYTFNFVCMKRLELKRLIRCALQDMTQDKLHAVHYALGTCLGLNMEYGELHGWFLANQIDVERSVVKELANYVR